MCVNWCVCCLYIVFDVCLMCVCMFVCVVWLKWLRWWFEVLRFVGVLFFWGVWRRLLMFNVIYVYFRSLFVSLCLNFVCKMVLILLCMFVVYWMVVVFGWASSRSAASALISRCFRASKVLSLIMCLCFFMCVLFLRSMENFNVLCLVFVVSVIVVSFFLCCVLFAFNASSALFNWVLVFEVIFFMNVMSCCLWLVYFVIVFVVLRVFVDVMLVVSFAARRGVSFSSAFKFFFVLCVFVDDVWFVCDVLICFSLFVVEVVVVLVMSDCVWRSGVVSLFSGDSGARVSSVDVVFIIFVKVWVCCDGESFFWDVFFVYFSFVCVFLLMMCVFGMNGSEWDDLVFFVIDVDVEMIVVCVCMVFDCVEFVDDRCVMVMVCEDLWCVVVCGGSVRRGWNGTSRSVFSTSGRGFEVDVMLVMCVCFWWVCDDDMIVVFDVCDVWMLYFLFVICKLYFKIVFERAF